MFFWTTFKNRKAGTIEAVDRLQAGERAAAFGVVDNVFVMPYPRAPKLEVESNVPSFCYGGLECLNRTSCPKRPSCTS